MNPESTEQYKLLYLDISRAIASTNNKSVLLDSLKQSIMRHYVFWG